MATVGRQLVDSDTAINSRFRFGEWLVAADENVLFRGSERLVLQPKLMRVLVYLAERAGQVVSAEQLLIDCWQGTFHGDNPVHKTIALLRRALEDDPQQPRYIQTVRKRGYRVLMPVSFPEHYSGTVAQSVPVWSDGCPFRGLEAFDEQHAGIFFGRNRATAQLLQLLRNQIENSCAFVLVVGASGCGKSSLIHAGALPLLRQPGGFDGLQIEWTASIDPGQGSVLSSLAAALVRGRYRSHPAFIEGELPQLAADLAHDVEGVIERMRFKLQSRTKLGNLPLAVLVIDPLEALLDNPAVERSEREAFIRALSALAQSGLIAVLAACRSDMYARLGELAALVALKSEAGHFDLFPPTPGEIADMIRLPARAAGLVFGRDAVTHLRLDDALLDAATRNPDALPLLQHVLRELYQRRVPHGELLYSSYCEIGGLEGALSSHAETVLAGLPPEVSVVLPSMLKRMVATGDEGVIVGRRVAADSLHSPAERQLAQAFVDARLFTSRDAHVCAAHEALWRCWPRASGWVERNRAQLLAHSRVRLHAQRWEQARRPADLLLARGLPLTEAVALLEDRSIELTDSEQALITASAARSRAVQRIKAITLGGVVTLSLLAGAAGLYAWQFHREAERNRASAEGLIAFMLGDLTSNLRPLGKLDVLDRVNTEVLRHLDRSNDPAAGFTFQLQRVDALTQVGTIETERGNLERAASAFNNADRSLQQLSRAHGEDVQLLSKWGTVQYGLGNLALIQDRLERAHQHFQRYRELAEQLLLQQPQHQSWRMEASYAYNNVGTVELRRGNLHGAVEAFARSIEFKRQLLAADPDNVKLKADLANGLIWLATAGENSGALRQAADHYAEAQQLVTAAAVSAPDDMTLVMREALARMRTADLQIAMARVAAARDQYGVVLALLHKLTSTDPDNPSWQATQLYARIQQARLLSLQDDAPAARSLLMRVMADIDGYEGQHRGNPNWTRLQANGMTLLGKIQQRLGEHQQARSSLERAAAQLDALLRNDAVDGESRYALANTLAALGECLQHAGEPMAARQMWSRVLDLLGTQASTSDDKRVLAPLARALSNLGRGTEAEQLTARLTAMGYAEPALYDLPTDPSITRRVSR